MQGGSSFLLRAEQVAPLESGQTTPMLVFPDTTLSAVANSGSPSTVVASTVTVTKAASSATDRAITTITAPSSPSNRFTAGEMAGVVAGVGVPLLLALLGALLVILSQRRQLKKIRASANAQSCSQAPATQHTGNRWPLQRDPQHPPSLRQVPQYQYPSNSASERSEFRPFAYEQQSSTSFAQELSPESATNEMPAEHVRLELDGKT